ncbi:CarD family transcriptional regulator [Candidatus Acidulodesulfobacterium sp. H_13]|uniref:CarD family transcriptional regulator n=1 Tax=Candidatus Acidulodesulfobacterium sp. H_13 TaxID=3395470 RepID=UPI003AF53BFE
MFSLDEFVFYPGYGVCIVESISAQKIGSSELSFYNIRVMENNAKIMVPVKNTLEVGLRLLIREDEIQKVFDVLEEKCVKRPFARKESWNKRFNGYNLKLCSSCLFEVAEVLRDLYILKREKELSFAEKKMFEKAKYLIIKELSTVMNRPETFVEEKIKKIFVGQSQQIAN